MILGKNYDSLVKVKPSDQNSQRLNFMLFEKNVCVAINKNILIIYKVLLH